MASHQFMATCAFGLEAVLARELKDLGLQEVVTDNGHVAFSGDFLAMARANLWARTADRIWLRLSRFPATTFEQLFEGTRKLPWAQILPQNASFPVEGLSFGSQLSSVPACQSIVKKAVVEALKGQYRLERFPEDGPVYPIRVSLQKDQASLLLDTSGTGLHKRGYRLLTTGAPMRETLAAALVQLSYWNAGRLLVDPFCGSGTILVEAAMIGLRRAPGWDRDFSSRHWGFVGEEVWSEAMEEVEQTFDRTTTLDIFGWDIDPEALRSARSNVRKAGLEERGIFFETRSVRDFRSRHKYGVLITNPPYGERLSDRREVEDLYAEFGRAVRPLLDTWSVYVLTAHADFPHLFGAKEQRRRKLYNGQIECTYFQYPGPRPPRAESTEA
jgi:putative N6-adenine-specific DNA methylase